MPHKLSLAFFVGFFSLFLLALSYDASIAGAQGLDDETPSTTSVSGFQFSSLLGKKVDMLTAKGYFYNVEVKEVVPGKLDNSVKSFKLVEGKKNARIVASKVIEMHLEGENLDVSYDKKNRSLIQDPEKRAERLAYEKEAKSRLRPQGHRLWKHLTVEEQDVFLNRQAAFVKDAREKLKQIPLRVVETKFFTFVTDLNSAEVDGYIVYLDAMYAELCKAFGLPTDKNIWAGKCVVFAFRKSETYFGFETVVMKINEASIANTQGLCHQNSDGTVIFAGYKGNNNFFGHVLVHETSHGFVHRYLSSARAPSWLNEGMADWLADKVVKGKQIGQRQRASAANVKRKGSWGDVLNIPRITGEQYGICSVLVEILVARDGGRGNFKAFFDGMKEGHSAQECLKEHFNLTYAELQGIYGQTISNWK